MKKFLAAALIMGLSLSMSTSVMAAKESKEPKEPDAEVFEAEYTYMEDVVGGGISGAAAGLNMIMENKDASNEFYVGSTHSQKCVITYKITSDKDTSATLRLVLANELGEMKINPKTLIITVNDEEFEYKEFKLPAEKKSVGKTFSQFKLGDIDLKSGENTITFQIGENEYCNGGTGGPLFDCIKLTCDAKLTMEEYPENIE